MNKNGSKNKKSSKIKHHAHTAEDDNPPRKRVKQENEDSLSEDEYVLIFALTRISLMEAKIGLLIVGIPNT